MEALWELIAIVLAVSVVSLGCARAPSSSSRFRWCWRRCSWRWRLLGIDLQRISLGALIIALGLLVDDAMITIESMVFRAGTRRQQGAGRRLCLRLHRLSAAHRDAGHHRGVPAVGFARSAAGEYTFSMFAVVASGAADLLGGPRPVCPARRRGGAARPKIRMARPGVTPCALPALPPGGDAAPVDHHRWSRSPCSSAALARHPLVPEQFFPASDRPELLVDFTLRAAPRS